MVSLVSSLAAAEVAKVAKVPTNQLHPAAHGRHTGRQLPPLRDNDAADAAKNVEGSIGAIDKGNGNVDRTRRNLKKKKEIKGLR